MATNIVPEELSALIQEYLTDGVLTNKERQVILKKAEKMGLDRDEIDLYLDAQVQKIDQAAVAATNKQKGKTCPYCGGSIPLLTDKCPHCGENITAQSSNELQEIFDNLEDALVQLKSGRNFRNNKAVIERYVRKAQMYYGNNPKVKSLLEKIDSETSLAANKAQKKEDTKNKVNGLGCLISSLMLFVPLSLPDDVADNISGAIGFAGLYLGVFFICKILYDKFFNSN